MKHPKLIKIADIPLEQIEVVDRQRPVSDAGVEGLRASIETIGLQSEIHVRKPTKKDGLYRLILGGHRLEAFRQMGRETIPAKIIECTLEAARLMEVDENLARADLQPLDLCVFLHRRKTIYEKAYPETQQGVAGSAARWGATDTMSVASFVPNTAQKTGLSQRHVRRLVEVGGSLTEEDVSALRAAATDPMLADLLALAKCKTAKARSAACKAFSEGKVKNVRAALAPKPKAEPKNAEQEQEKALDAAFKRAGKRVKRRFVEEHATELVRLLDEISRGEEDGQVLTFPGRKRGGEHE
ncbi:ParB/RepB/Spo0J family partition protein [Thalassococcus sp. S3]|uniref:ParB/RepB/Spo0J family partition protein n=1 Tax=Thalassococcus sp. S3 TaxID=2017482 RepID=UPI0010244992|nr:ParB/RepB/Spo0J family partition protein [Thalassococcus sp. S3]QBF31537.1 chromosome partitioning protein ParB [Thalassococcus sp. S3]